MAKFSELRLFYEQSLSGSDGPILAGEAANSGFGVNDHVSSNQSQWNNEFVKSHGDIPGVLDFYKCGFTEPEDYRDCYNNNYALARIEESMQYLEKFNKYLTAEELESPDYSLYTLHLAAECLNAHDSYLTTEQIDYMIDKGFPRDKDFFGGNHYEYNMFQICNDFEAGRTFEEEDVILSSNPSAATSVGFFINKYGFDEDYIKVIGKNESSGAAFGVYEYISRHINDNKGEILAKADVMTNVANTLYNLPLEQKAIDISGEKTGYRFMDYDMDTMVSIDIADVVEKLSDKYWMDSSKDILQNKMDRVLAEYLKPENSKYRWLNDYVDSDSETFNIIQRGMGDGNLMMFYSDSNDSHGASRSMLDSYAKSHNMKVTFGMESEGFNGDTFILYNPETFQDYDGPQWVKDYVAKEEKRASKTESVSQPKKIDSKSFVTFENIKEKSLRKQTGKDGESFYSVALAVPTTISDNGMAFVTFSESVVTKKKDVYSVKVDASSNRTIGVMKNGERSSVKMIMGDLAKAHNVRLSKNAASREDVDIIDTQSGMDDLGSNYAK